MNKLTVIVDWILRNMFSTVHFFYFQGEQFYGYFNTDEYIIKHIMKTQKQPFLLDHLDLSVFQFKYS